MNPGSAATERLYYTDAHRSEFTATVIDTAENNRRVYLDQTAFYPTSGGQPHDLGSLGGVAVVDVIDEGDRIAHVLERPLTASGSVEGKIDWRRRWDYMQQHTGQHLLSAVFEDLFGAPTISVHFGDTYSTLDLEIDSLSTEKIVAAERRANEVIAENRAVTVTFEDAASAAGLRKAVDRSGTLRIISIDGIDRSACGGTHVQATSRIGCVMLRGTERIRKTMRVEFLCGQRAIDRARADFQMLTGIAASLSAAVDAIPALVVSQAAQLKDAEQTLRRAERANAQYEAKALYESAPTSASGIRLISMTLAADAKDRAKSLAQAATELSRAVVLATLGDGGFLVASSEDSDADAGKLVRDALTTIKGKGGGSPRIAQGSTAEPEAAKVLDAIRAALERGQ